MPVAATAKECQQCLAEPRPLVALALVVGTVAATSATASAATINVSPTTVAAGGNVHLSGDVLAGDGTPGCGCRAP